MTLVINILCVRVVVCDGLTTLPLIYVVIENSVLLLANLKSHHSPLRDFYKLISEFNFLSHMRGYFEYNMVLNTHIIHVY